MRKIYSLVLMTAMLFIGANAWANETWTNLPESNEGNTAEASVTIGGTTKYAGTLSIAFAAVDQNEVATIALLKNVSISNTITIQNGQNITLVLGVANDERLIQGSDYKKVMFSLKKGKLDVTGYGNIEYTQYDANQGTPVIAEEDWNKKQHGWIGKGPAAPCFELFGSTNESDTDYTYLQIGKNVTVKSAYTPLRVQSGNGSPYNNCAYGVNVHVYGKLIAKLYGIQVSGTVSKTPYNAPTANTNAFPHVNIYPGANIRAASVHDGSFPYAKYTEGGEDKYCRKQPTGIYCSGYAVWNIQGIVRGANGIYMKMGDVTVEGAADIAATSPTSNGGNQTGSGITGVGNAITMQSNWSEGTMSITVKAGEDENGNAAQPTISAAEGSGGAALADENVTNNTNQVTNVNIEAGDFSGDVDACVVISDDFTGELTVTGGTYEGNIETLIEALPDDGASLIQDVVQQDGENAKIVIGPVKDGDQPAAIGGNPSDTVNFDWTAVDAKSVVTLKASANTGNLVYTLDDNTITASDTTKVRYLSLKGTKVGGTTYTNTITIADNHILLVDQIVMDAYASIVVEPGSKLIVTGSNGIFASKSSNIVLQASGNNSAIFLLSPAVDNNATPSATVEFSSKSWRESASQKVYQFFGCPVNNVESLTSSSSTYQTAIYRLGSSTPIGIMSDGTLSDVSGLNNPYAIYYMLSTNDRNNLMTYTFKGNLMGNSNPNVVVENNWSPLANSFTGNIDIDVLLAQLTADYATTGIEPNVYTYSMVGAQKITWNVVNEILNSLDKLAPMQPLMLKNRNSATTIELNYNDLVWTPATTAPATAPMRSNLNDWTKAIMRVTDEDGVFDIVAVAESEMFSSEYEAGYDAEKYMNEGMNIYVNAEMPLNVLASDNINNTYLGFQSDAEGLYTISFDEISGENLVLVDLVTNAHVAMIEGASYQFYANANETNDYRFEIVSISKLPTDIETINKSLNNAGAVYTLMGQYVGNMADWNTLPAGMYIVDGVKRIK